MMYPLTQRGLNGYISIGQSAMANIEESLAEANLTYADIASCLDLPCGHGRVLRWLQTKIDPARITASDIDKRAVDFCHSEFGVKRLYSADDFAQLKFSERYTLIWVGSLLTHLDSDRCLTLLTKLVGVMEAGGLLIFTTQGDGCLTTPGLIVYSKNFRDIEDQLKGRFFNDGFCYAPYGPLSGYGVALHSKSYVEQLMTKHFPEVKLVRFKERGWDDHQDVWAYQRV